MKFTVTIKDNETGELLVNEECKAFLLTEQKGDEGERTVFASNCNYLELMALFAASFKGFKKNLKRNPEIAGIVTGFLKSEGGKESE